MIESGAHTDFNLPYILSRPHKDMPPGSKRGVPMKYFTKHETLKWEWLDSQGRTQYADAIGVKTADQKGVGFWSNALGWGPLDK